MEKTLFVLLSLVLTFGSLDAREPRIITVDNKYPSMGEYTTIQAAHDAAQAGDTIYVYPSVIPYSGIEVTKKLTLIGNGWAEPGFALYSTTISGDMKFSANSDGSKLISFGGYFRIEIDAGDIQILRNQIIHIGFISYNFVNNIRRILVSQNSVILPVNKLYNELQNILIYVNPNYDLYISNIFFEIGNCSSEPYLCHNPMGFIVSMGSTLYLTNNYFHLPIHDACNTTDCGNYLFDCSNSTITFVYNIVQGGYFCRDNCPIQSRNNLSLEKYERCSMTFYCCYYMFGVENYAPPDEVFASGYHVIPNSKASKEMNNGRELGIYGGPTPFVDGGYPGIPIINDLNSEDVGSKQNGLKVKFKAKSNKD